MTQTSAFARASELAAAMFAASPTLIAETIGGTPIVHEGDIDFSDQAAYPRPLVMVEPKTIHRPLYSGGDLDYLNNEGFIDFTMIRNTTATLLSDPDAAARDHYEFFGLVLDEFALLAGDGSTGDALSVIALGITACGKPDATIFANLGECFICQGRIHWGNQHLGRSVR